MALPCLLTRMSMRQCLMRGQTLRTSSVLVRSSAFLSNRDSQIPTAKNQLQLNQAKFPLVPASFTQSVRYSSGGQADEPEYKKHSHITIWTMERIVAAGLLGIIPVALLSPSQALDTAVAVMVTMHTHWGLEAIVVDYIRPIIFGNVIPKVSLGLLYVFTFISMAGLLNLIFNDAGLANTVIHIMKS